MKKSIQATFLALVSAVSIGFVYAACSGDDAVTEPTADAGALPPGTNTPNDSGTTVNPDGGTLPDGAPADCFQGTPQTYLDIINACTTATRIAKTPQLDKLLPDGGVPPPS